MSETPNKKRGPKPKPREELSERLMFTFPPALAAEVRQWIPAGERAAVVQECLAREVERRKQAQAE